MGRGAPTVVPRHAGPTSVGIRPSDKCRQLAALIICLQITDTFTARRLQHFDWIAPRSRGLASRLPTFPSFLHGRNRPIQNLLAVSRPAVRMKIAFVVNDVQTELAAFTTTRLAMAAANMGHQSFVFGVGDFLCATDGSIHARAHTPRSKSYKSLEKFLADIQSADRRACESAPARAVALPQPGGAFALHQLYA